MKNTTNNYFAIILVIFIFSLTAIGAITLFNSIFRSGPDTTNMWTLMLCDEMLDSSQCYSASTRIPNLSSKYECQREGYARIRELAWKYKGFECGRNCRPDSYSDGLICTEICNSQGCSY